VRERTCSWVGYAPHRTDSIIRLIRGRPGERFLSDAGPADARGRIFYDNGQDARWPHRQDACATKLAVALFISKLSINNPQLSVAVKEAADGVTQTFPIDWLGEMRGETGGFGGGDVADGSESAKRDSVYLTGVTQLVHQIQAAAVG
jgi:hypothetical protein